MPHGGTLGGNFVESFLHDLEKYFSPEAKEERKKEEEKWNLQKEEARKSWDKFERDNPQCFPK